MSLTATPDKPKAQGNTKAPAGAERRRRKRAKISAQLRARPAHSPQLFEDICKTVDVSRDGLLFAATRKGYAKGQRLEITFPYTHASEQFNQPQIAEVVRVDRQPDGAVYVAIEFLAARERAQPAKGGLPKAASGGEEWMHSAARAVVLTIEPDGRVGDAMREALQLEGYDVLTVSTPRQAFQMMRQMDVVPVVVIADVESPDISGHDLCVVIKRDERLQAVPVILLTRAEQPADYSSNHSLGAVVCMAKPFKTERLKHMVKLVAPPVIKNSYSAQFGAVSVSKYLL